MLISYDTVTVTDTGFLFGSFSVYFIASRMQKIWGVWGRHSVTSPHLPPPIVISPLQPAVSQRVGMGVRSIRLCAPPYQQDAGLQIDLQLLMPYQMVPLHSQSLNTLNDSTDPPHPRVCLPCMVMLSEYYLGHKLPGTVSPHFIILLADHKISEGVYTSSSTQRK